MLSNERFTALDRQLLQMAAAAPRALTIAVRDLGHICLVQCSGMISPGDEHRLREFMDLQSSEREIVLDLAHIESIDTAGIGALVALRGWALTADTGFKLMNLNPQVERLLRATNLIATFHLCTAHETLTIWCRATRCGREQVIIG